MTVKESKEQIMYTEKQILTRLRKHLIDNMGSVWTMHKPTWQGVQKRITSDADFEEKVRDLVAEANHKWEKMGITALVNNDEAFNVQLYKHFTANKKAFLSYETLELDERISKLEEYTK